MDSTGSTIGDSPRQPAAGRSNPRGRGIGQATPRNGRSQNLSLNREHCRLAIPGEPDSNLPIGDHSSAVHLHGATFRIFSRRNSHTESKGQPMLITNQQRIDGVEIGAARHNPTTDKLRAH
jgi:hypothetical protein